MSIFLEQERRNNISKNAHAQSRLLICVLIAWLI